jgi:hypothetical protein
MNHGRGDFTDARSLTSTRSTQRNGSVPSLRDVIGDLGQATAVTCGTLASASQIIESILLTTVAVLTFKGSQRLSNASGFFFERDQRLFLVTSRHVLLDKPSRHFPDRVEIRLHIDSEDLTESLAFSIPLYAAGLGVWRNGSDGAGDIDVAMIEIERDALPANIVYRSFDPEHLPRSCEAIEVGSPLLVVGYPLGFHDTLHHLPIVRQAIIASSYGLRFQGQGYFLTDARTHRGTSGAPVVMHARPRDQESGDLPWVLLGIHSARLDVGPRSLLIDEALGLNCAWYSDILMTLSARRER